MAIIQLVIIFVGLQVRKVEKAEAWPTNCTARN